MSTRFVQLTDLHLFDDPDGELKGVPTWRTLEEILQRLRRDYADAEALILTGDLAHDERRATYEMLREALGPWNDRLWIVPGNHDDRASIRSLFADRVPAGTGPVTFSTGLDRWRLLGLDSHVAGEVAGDIDDAQLGWLRGELRAHAAQPTIVFVHHPPVSVESPWLDRIMLENPQPLMDALAASEQVRLVIAGHVHQEFTTRAGHFDVLTTPATSVQFKPRTTLSTTDRRPPGFRWFELSGTNLRTGVARLDRLRYPPIE